MIHSPHQFIYRASVVEGDAAEAALAEAEAVEAALADEIFTDLGVTLWVM